MGEKQISNTNSIKATDTSEEINVVLVCHSSAEYIASILDRWELQEALGKKFFPLLCDSDDDRRIRFSLPTRLVTVSYAGSKSLERVKTRPLAESIEICCRISYDQSTATDPCCVILEEDDAAIVGAALSLFSQRRLILLKKGASLASLQEMIGAASSVVFILSSTQCSAFSFDEMRNQLGTCTVASNAQSIQRRPWGLLTASNLKRLANLTARVMLRKPSTERQGAIYSMYSSPSFKLNEPCLKEINLPLHPSEALQPLTQHGMAFASFIGHGRPYCALAGHLCSLVDFAEAGDTKCVNGFQCIFSTGPRIPAGNLLADVVFMDICNTASFTLPSPQREEGLNLAVHMLDGFTSAVIAPYRTNYALDFSSYLAWSLFEQGLSIGQVCCDLNQFSAARLNVPDPYILLGDPEMRVFADPFKVPKQLTAYNDTAGIWHMKLPSPPPGIESYQCHDERFVEQAKKSVLYYLGTSSLGDRFIADVLPVESGSPSVHLLTLCAEQESQHDSIILKFTTRPPFRQEVIAIAAQFLENLRVEERWFEEEEAGSPATTGSSAKQDLEMLTRSIEPAVVSSVGLPITPPSRYFVLYRLEQRILSLCFRLGKQLIQQLAHRSKKTGGVWMYLEYGHSPGIRSVVYEEQIPAPCYSCGGSVQRRLYQVGLWPQRIRQLLECERCMFLCDVEIGNDSLITHAPSHVFKGEEFEFSVEGYNTLNVPAIIHSAVAVDRVGNPIEAFQISPDIQEAFVMPGESFKFVFKILPAKVLTTHLFNIKCFISLNGSISWALKKVTILNKVIL